MRHAGFAAIGAAVCLALSVLVPTAADADTFDRITVNHPNATTTVFRIDRPNPTRQTSNYPSILFHRGDQIVIDAGGCVQTGGYGLTWKSYTDPQGGSADYLYSGTVYIRGVIPFGADGGYQRIGGVLEKTLRVPTDLPPSIKDSDLSLHLGYQDDNYSDNSYDGHDNGDNDQCLNVGAAWVVISITTDTAPATGWTPRSKPFDLSWRMEDIDANGLPVNPFWGAQFDPHKPFGSDPDPAHFVADFQGSCGPAFSWSYGNHGMVEDLTALNADCTTQAPTSDFDHSSSVEPGPLSYCHPEPLSGHLDWAYATLTGRVVWDQYSGNQPFGDTDMNFWLVIPGFGALTREDPMAVGIEVRSGETLDNYADPFWKNLRANAEGGGDMTIASQIDRKFAVVSGLLGIDGVHGGATEIHPATTMAICLSGCTELSGEKQGEEIVDGADQHWVFFVQNYGAGGECSSSEHFWPGLNSHDGKAWYFLSLPWPPGATGVKMSAQQLNASETVKSSKPKQWGKWDMLGFELPDPTNGSGASVDGEFILHYTIPKPPPQRSAVVYPTTAIGRSDEDADMQSVLAKMTDPVQKARLLQLMKATPGFTPRPHPDAISTNFGDDGGAAEAVATVTKDKARSLTRDHPYADADYDKWKANFVAQVVKIMPPKKAPDAQKVSPAR